MPESTLHLRERTGREGVSLGFLFMMGAIPKLGGGGGPPGGAGGGGGPPRGAGGGGGGGASAAMQEGEVMMGNEAVDGGGAPGNPGAVGGGRGMEVLRGIGALTPADVGVPA